MKRDLKVGDFFREAREINDSGPRTGVVLEVFRNPDDEGIVKVLLCDGNTEGWDYRTFVDFHEVCV